MVKYSDDPAGSSLLHGVSPPPDLFRILKVLASRWYWLLAVMVIFVLAGWLFIKLVKPSYVAEATLEYLEKKSVIDDLNTSVPGYFFSNGNEAFRTEKYKIISGEVITNALNRTRPFFVFFRIKDLRKIDTYPFFPVDTEILHFDENLFESGVFVLSDDLKLSYRLTDQIIPLDYGQDQVVEVRGLTFRIKEIHTAPGYDYEFEYAATPKRLKEITERLELKEVNEHIPVMKLTFKHHNQEFATGFIHHLLEAYEAYDLKQKLISTDLTLTFIQSKLKELDDSLKNASAALKVFRVQKQLADPEGEIKESALQIRTLEQEGRKLLLEKEFVDLLQQNLDTALYIGIDFLPLGWDEQADRILVMLLDQYNELIGKRHELLVTRLPVSAAVKNIDLQINQLKRRLVENLKHQHARNEKAWDFNRDQLTQQKKRMVELPAHEQDYQNLLRNYQINEHIYSLLVNRQLEASVMKSGMVPSFKIIDIHEVEKIFPKKGQTMIFFCTLGLLCGCMLVLVKRKINNRFYRFQDLNALHHVKLVGVIPHFSDQLKDAGEDVVLLNNDRSSFSEAFSNLRMQISVNTGTAENGKIVVITSFGAGDGKSFVGVNLGLSFARMNKRILLIGADMRMPSVDKYFSVNGKSGLSDYLENPGINVTDIIQQTAIQGIHHISAGQGRCYNSTELLQNGAIQVLLETCRKDYDIIILDTPPVGILSDAIPLMQLADQILYIVRWLYSPETAGQYGDAICKQFGFKNMQLLVNDYYKDGLYQSLVSYEPESWLPAIYSQRKDGDGYYLVQRNRTGRNTS